jgi:hypothetical protein
MIGDQPTVPETPAAGFRTSQGVTLKGMENQREIFVFGSNRTGIHGAGAALEARQNHGAHHGWASGLQGNSYAIVTKELRWFEPSVDIDEIRRGVRKFLKFARKHPEMIFNVTPIGCGLAGFTPEQIAPLFNVALGIPENVKLPEVFLKVVN